MPDRRKLDGRIEAVGRGIVLRMARHGGKIELTHAGAARRIAPYRDGRGKVGDGPGVVDDKERPTVDTHVAAIRQVRNEIADEGARIVGAVALLDQ